MKIESLKKIQKISLLAVASAFAVVVLAFLLEWLIPGDNYLFIIAILAGVVAWPLFFLFVITWIMGMFVTRSVTKRDLIIGASLFFALFILRYIL